MELILRIKYYSVNMHEKYIKDVISLQEVMPFDRLNINNEFVHSDPQLITCNLWTVLFFLT